MKRTHLIPLPSRRQRFGALVLVAVSATAGIYLVARAAGTTGSPGPDRLHRQVGVMEGIFDKILRDSPNFVVSGREYTRGVVLPDYGVVFSFNASVNDNELRLAELSSLVPLDIDIDDDGTVIVGRKVHAGDPDDEDSLKEEIEQSRQEAEKVKEKAARLRDKAKRMRGRVLDLRDWDKERSERSRELYAAGKEELVQALLDYGETLSELKDGQWIVLAGFFDRDGFLRDRDVSRMVLRAKVDDLRAYSAGRLSESAARERVIAEEY